MLFLIPHTVTYPLSFSVYGENGGNSKHSFLRDTSTHPTHIKPPTLVTRILHILVIVTFQNLMDDSWLAHPYTPVVYILLRTANPLLLRVVPGSLLSISSMTFFTWFIFSLFA